MDNNHSSQNNLPSNNVHESNFTGFVDGLESLDSYSSNLQPPTTFFQTEHASSNINYNDVNASYNYTSVTNDDNFSAPYVNTPVMSSNHVNYQQPMYSNNENASTSQFRPQYIAPQLIDNTPSPLNSFNITINSPNLSEIFRLGFRITITPISSPTLTNLDNMQNQLQQDYYLNQNIITDITDNSQNQFQP